MKLKLGFVISACAMMFVSCASWGFTPKTRPEAQSGASAEQSVSQQSSSVQKSSGTQPDVPERNHNDTQQSSAASNNASSQFSSQSSQNSSTTDMPIPVEPTPCELAEDALSQATIALMRYDWSAAVVDAQNAAQCDTALEWAKQVAFFAVSQMDLPELRAAWVTNGSLFGRAVFGLEAIRLCAVHDDMSCIEDMRSETVFALSSMGMTEQAQEVAALSTSQQTSGRPVVAVALPLSGRDRRMGRAILGGMLQVAGAYAHKGLAFDLRFFDTASSPDTLPMILSQASQFGAKLVLGPLDIQEAQAAAAALATNDLVMMSFAPNDAFVSERAFQLSFSMDNEARVLADMINIKGYTQVVAAYPEGKYGDILTDAVVQYAPGKLVKRFTYNASQTDLRDVAKKIASAKPDAVFLPAEAKDAERLMSFVAQEGLWCRNASTPAKPSKNDSRVWTNCFASSAWAPVPPQHEYRYIVGASYLDYASGQPSGEDFSTNFDKLYHRLPNVYEVMPLAAVEVLNKLSTSDFTSSQALSRALQAHLGGTSKLMTPVPIQVIQ